MANVSGWLVCAALCLASVAQADDLTDAEKKALMAGEVVYKVVMDNGVETVLMVTPLKLGYQVYKYVVSRGQSANEMSAALRAGKALDATSPGGAKAPKGPPPTFDPPAGWEVEPVPPPAKIENTPGQEREEKLQQSMLDSVKNAMTQTGLALGKAESGARVWRAASECLPGPAARPLVTAAARRRK